MFSHRINRRAKLVIAFVLTAILPMTFLALINGRTTRDALVDDANQALFAVASQTASTLDAFIATTLISQTITCQIDTNVFFYDSNGRASQVTEADIQASNGVIHIVDSVLLPDGTLTDITSNVDILSSLNGALVDTGLDETLSGEGTFTVFAPTNDAVAAFVADGGEITSDVLLYHVLPAVYFSGDIPDGETVLATANTDGDEVTIIKNGTGVFVKDAIDRIATVTLANIAGTNGVAHVIDIVLSPTELMMATTEMSSTEATIEDKSGVNRMSISVFCITFYFLAFLIFT